MKKVKTKTVNCVVCGKFFATARSDAQTCSAYCRKELSRRAKRPEEMGTHIVNVLLEMTRLARKDTRFGHIYLSQIDMIATVCAETVIELKEAGVPFQERMV